MYVFDVYCIFLILNIKNAEEKEAKKNIRYFTSSIKRHHSTESIFTPLSQFSNDTHLRKKKPFIHSEIYILQAEILGALDYAS